MLQPINTQDTATAAPLGLYVHWPFCLSKCPYCDFNSHVSNSIDHDAFLRGYRSELRHFAQQVQKRPLRSIFFGGGTPSLMPAALVENIITSAADIFGLEQGCEITLEANPTSFETEKFKSFKAAGVNRVSIGVQSLYEDALKFLGRQHNAQEAREAIKSAQSIFDRLSFDLIYARPEQSLNEWRRELTEALALGSTHLSLYQLTIERGTAFHTMYQRGDFSIPEDDQAADLYELTQEMTKAAGLTAYETSNHAALGEESQHNLIYWRYQDYIGIGPGAHGRFINHESQKVATRTHLAPQKWLELCHTNGHGCHPDERITNEMQFQEALMMGLRLSEGVDLEALGQISGVDWQAHINHDQLSQLIKNGFLQRSAPSAPHITPTPAGALCVNALIHELLA